MTVSYGIPQLLDSSEHNQNLSYNVIEIPNPSSPTAPEGDRWLAFHDNDDELDLIMPLGPRPNSNKGRLSFYFKGTPDVDSSIYIFDTNDGGMNDRFLSVISNGDGTLDFVFTDGDGVTQARTFAINVFDEQTHQIWITWNNTTQLIKGYVDGIADPDAWIPGCTFDFGDSSYSQITETRLEGNYGSGYFYIDDVIVSANDDDPLLPPDISNYIAWWKGNSDGQLLDATDNGNDLSVDTVYIDSPIYPTPPVGQRWLGHWIYGNISADYFNIPNTLFLNQQEGNINFYVRISNSNSDSGYISLLTYQNNNGYLTINAIFSSQILHLTYLGTDSNEYGVDFNNSSKIFDGETHKITISWDDNGLKSYIDDILQPENCFQIKPYVDENSVSSSIGSATISDISTEVFIDDFKFSDVAYVPNAKTIARWGGNSDGGQTFDSSGNGNDLTLQGTIDNPGFLLTPQVPEGVDSWLLSIGDRYNNVSGDNNLEIPITARPSNVEGYISFYFRMEYAGGWMDSDVFDFDTEIPEGDQKYFYAYFNNNGLDDQTFSIDVIDANNNHLSRDFNFSGKILDGNNHKIVMSWDSTGLKCYVDDVLDTSASVGGFIPNFGDDTYSHKNEAMGLGLFNESSGDGNNFFIADVVISNIAYVPTSVNYTIAEYKGNSNGQLLDASGNKRNLVKVGIVSNASTIAPPEGDRWLGKWTEASSVDDYLVVPISAKPENAQGYISFYLNQSTSNPLNYFNYFAMDTVVGNDYLTERWCYIYPNGVAIQMDFVDIDGNNRSVYVGEDLSGILFDGNNHKVAFSWIAESEDSVLIKLYIDDIEYNMGGDIDTPIDFGTGLDADGGVINTSIGGKLFTANDGDTGTILIDDVKISKLPYVLPRASWSLENDGRDSSGNSFDLITVGNPTFDGESVSGFTLTDYLQFPQTLLDDIARYETFTIQMDVYLNEEPNSGQQLLTFNGDSDMEILFNSGSGSTINFYNGSNNTMAITPTTEVWHTYTMACYADEIEIYIDGNEVSEDDSIYSKITPTFGAIGIWGDIVDGVVSDLNSAFVSGKLRNIKLYATTLIP